MFAWLAHNAMSPQYAEFNMWKDTVLRLRRKRPKKIKEKKNEK
jgi:hypothetical protein